MQSSKSQSITRIESFAILLASGLGALSALVATWLANRYLAPSEVTEFLLIWAVIFALFSIVAGVQTEATRGVANVQIHSAHPKSRALAAPLVVGAAVALIIGMTYSFWGPHSRIPVVVIAIGIGLYAVHYGVVGSLAGFERWYLFSALNGGEALVRLCSLATAGLIFGSLFSFELAVLVPVALWWLVLCITSRQGREALWARTDVPLTRSLRNSLFAMGSSTAAAILMNGFPLILSASESPSKGSTTYLVMGALILAVSICRSPIMIPLQAFNGVAIAAFLRYKDTPLRAFAKPAIAVLGVGTLGGIAAALLGPWLFLLIYPPKPSAEHAYAQVAQPAVLGMLTFASACMALLTLSGSAVLALNAHRGFFAGWAIGAIGTVAVLFVAPLPLIERVIVALILGPALGCGTHLSWMTVAARKSRPLSPGLSAPPTRD